MTNAPNPAEAALAVHMRWVDPPADVVAAVSALHQRCETWPKTPISNPLAVVSGIEDALCQAAPGHALFVPEKWANSIFQIGTFVIMAFIVEMVAVAGFGSLLSFYGRNPLGPPRPKRLLTDALAAVVLFIGWFGWLSASGLVMRYSLG